MKIPSTTEHYIFIKYFSNKLMEVAPAALSRPYFNSDGHQPF